MHGLTRWLWQFFIDFESMAPEMVHCVVIQAAERDFLSAGFHLNPHLVKRRAGEDATADGAKLNNVFFTAGRVILERFDACFTHLLPDFLAEVAVHRIAQPCLQAPVALLLQHQSPCCTDFHVKERLSHRGATRKGLLKSVLKHQLVVRTLQ
jgi:hypothetical protein